MVEMEEAIGHVTAIGSVTMESGERIGNSLKTIYSRITTVKDATEALESLGIAINEIGENGEVSVRGVSDILGDLSLIWNDLSDAQRQNVAVTIAGRNQLSRFLALMNNWQTSVDATTTAYDSQGSALREQEAYMDSYEAKLNQVKTRMTELALAVGDAVLSDGLFLLIDLLGNAIEMGVDFVDTYGVLPVLLGTIGGSLKVFGVFDKVVGSIKTSLGDVKAFFGVINEDSSASIAKLSQNGTVAVSTMDKMGITAKATKTAFSQLGGAIKSIMVTGAITLAFVALGYALEKIISKVQEAKRAQEEWDKTVKTAVETYNSHGNNINSLIDEYDALNQKMQQNKEAMSDEELARYNQLVNELQTILPSVVDHVDANGQAHLRSVDAIKEEAEWIEKLATGQEDMMKLNFSETIEKNAQSMLDMANKIQEAYSKIQGTENVIEKGSYTVTDYGAGGTGVETTVNFNQDEMNDKLIRQRYEATKAEYEYNVALNDSIKSMQQYSLQMLTASGHGDNMTDTAKRMVEQFINANKAMLDIEFPEDMTDTEKVHAMEEAMDSLSVSAIELGEKINDMYGNLTEGLEGTDLAEVTQQIDALINSVPDDAFILPDGAFDTGKMDNYVETIGFMVQSIKNGDSDYRSMITTLESFGLSNNEASKFVAELGRTLDNTAIKNAVAREELETFNEELEDTTGLALEAIDPLNSLFQTSDDETKAISSYLEQMKILRAETDDWQNTTHGQNAINQLSNYFGLNKDYIAENAELLYQHWNAYQGMTYGYYDVLDEAGEAMVDEAGNAIQEYGMIFAEGTSEASKQFVRDMIKAGIDGGQGMVANFAVSIGAMDTSTEEMVTRINAEFSKLAENPSENFAGFFNTLQEDLDSLEGSFTLVRDEAGKMKFVMADGTQSEYLNTVNKQLDDLDMQVSITQDSTGEFWKVLIDDPEGGAPILSKVTNQAKDGSMAVAELSEKYGIMMQDVSNETAQSEFLSTVLSQAKIVGEEIVSVKDADGNMKLQFADGSSSYWLETVNQMLADSQISIQEVRDENGELKVALNTGERSVYLDGLITQAGEVSSKLEGTLNKANEVKSALNETGSLGQSGGGGWTNGLSAGDEVISGIVENIKTIGGAVDEVNNKTIAPKISGELNGQLTKVSDSIISTGEKVESVSQKVQEVQVDVAQVQSSVDVLNTSTTAISNASTNVQTLETSLGRVRQAFVDVATASIGIRSTIDISGLRTSIESIEGLVGRMRLSVEGIKNIYNEMAISTLNAGTSLNTDGIRSYQTEFSLQLLLVNSNFSRHIEHIRNKVGELETILNIARIRMTTYRTHTNSSLEAMNIMYTSFGTQTTRTIQLLVNNMTNHYNRGVQTIIDLTNNMRNGVAFGVNNMRTATDASMRAMGDSMVRIFRNSVGEIRAEANKLPSLIGGGIRANISEATSSITDLANTLVTNFKSALGIHSPSRVFEELGGYVMQGLVNGLSDGNLMSLGQKVFNEFGSGAFTTLDSIKGYLNADWAVANGDVQDWIASAVGITGVPASWIQPLMQIAMHESGGNPKAQNNWDINAINGIPSKGLMQTIDPTFQDNMMAGFGDIWNPVHNAIASINYILKRYGNVWNVPGIRGLTSGTGYVGYGEPTGNNENTESTTFTVDVPSYSDAIFSSSSDFGGESFGSGLSASVGNIVSQTTNIGNTFTASADNKEEMEALFKVNANQREADVYTAMLRRANTEMQALTENTLKYRNAMQEVNRQETELRKRLQGQLKDQKARHAQLQKELKTLGNTSKHTVEQRKRYNELQKEFEGSLDTIYTLENEIRSLEISMSERTVEIFEDYLGEIVGKYQQAIEKSNAEIDNIDFKLSVNEHSESDTLLDNMLLENQKLNQLLGQEKTVRNQIADLNNAYKNAQSRYGKNSEQAQLAYEAMLMAEEELEDAILDRLAQEKKIKDERERVSNDSVSILKDYYGQVKDITTSALEKEREELEKNHELRMSMYDDEIDRINGIYDAKIKSLDTEKEETKYAEELNAKNQSRVDLMNQISRASRDNSLEGKRNLANLQEQLATVNEEIANMQAERQDKLYREAIEAQRQEQIKAIETQKETADKEHDIRLEGITLQVEQAKQAYDSLIGDETMWKDLTDKFMAGDANPLLSMVESMEKQMAQMMSGDYSSIIPDFNKLSKDMQKEISNGNIQGLGNFTLEMSQTIDEIKEMTEFMAKFRANASGAVDYNNPSITDGSGTKYNSSVDIYAPKYTPPAKTPAPPTPAKPQRTYTIKAGDTLWDLAQQYYGNPFKWTTIAQANSNPDPYKLQIGRKLIIPFKSGGFTGEWVGDEGKIAMLHKKELVLNAEQTEHILSSAKIMDDVIRMIPRISLKQNNQRLVSESSGGNITIENMVLDFDNFKGTEKDADNMVNTFISKLKKR